MKRSYHDRIVPRYDRMQPASERLVDWTRPLLDDRFGHDGEWAPRTDPCWESDDAATLAEELDLLERIRTRDAIAPC